MNDRLITLYSYSNREDASEALLVLKANNIGYVIEDTAPTLDPFFVAANPTYSIHIKVRKADHENALALISSLLAETGDEELLDITEENLMEKYSSDELEDVIRKKDEWDEDDIAQAERILLKRGITVTQEEKEKMWQQRLEETRRPHQSYIGWTIFGFALSLMGGVLGIVMGASYFFIKKRDMLGQKHHAYDMRTRMLGLLMMIIGIAVAVITYDSFFGDVIAAFP